MVLNYVWIGFFLIGFAVVAGWAAVRWRLRGRDRRELTVLQHIGSGLSTEQMQHFTNWTNLSECTFLLPPTQAGAGEVRTLAVAGSPVEVLLDVVRRESADLLVVGNRGLNSLAGRLLGSVPQNVSHKAGCDVLKNGGSAVVPVGVLRAGSR